MSSENTSINIIIPVYNRAKLITHTLDSVYNSGLKNVRIICIDDGSDDDSVKTIKAYRLRTVHTVMCACGIYGGIAG